MAVPESLVAAYRAARYAVFSPGKVLAVMRIGVPCPEMDDLLDAGGASSAAFVTAHNPGGIPAREEANALAFGELIRATDPERTGYKVYPGEGNDPEGEWKAEPSLLIVGILRAEAEALGRRFRQNAIVWVEKGKAPELVLLA